MRNLLVASVLSLSLIFSGCVPYLVGVAVTSRMQAGARINCVEQGGEYVDGSSWGWSSGKCIMPKDEIVVKDLEKLTPQEACAKLGGIYYSSTEGCDLRKHD